MKCVKVLRRKFIGNVEDLHKSEENNRKLLTVFLHGCPYFETGKCASFCWNLNGPCGVCVENRRHNPANATKERLKKVAIIVGKETSITR